MVRRCENESTYSTASITAAASCFIASTAFITPTFSQPEPIDNLTAELIKYFNDDANSTFQVSRITKTVPLSEEVKAAANEVYQVIFESQKELDDDFKKVLYENLEDLYI